MKAKEYAKIYNDNPAVDVLTDIVIKFVKEVPEIAKKRHANSNMAILAILDEQENKWKAFCRLCPDVPTKMFQVLIKNEIPEVYEFWRDRRI